MARAFVRPGDLRELVAEQFGSDRRLVELDRLAGGSKKGVYRLGLDDATTVILYVWADAENYWPPSASRVVPDDPFTDASGADLFEAGQAALAAALRPVELDADRLALYRYAQVLSLIEAPLRIADTDLPYRDWMLDLAEHNIGKALAAIGVSEA